LSPDPEDAYFAAGMQDEIVSQLTKISGLRVFPVRPGSAAQVSLPEIMRGLNVATVLGGSVRYSEGRVLVTPHLTEAASGETRWSDSYERDLKDIFAIQHDIALAVAQALRLELSAAERQRVERVPTIDRQARDLYLRARGRNLSPEEVLRAIDEVEQALARDDKFKEAWVIDSLLRNYAQYTDPKHIDEHRRRGEQAALRAVALDPDFGEGYLALGWSLASKKDIAGAEAAFREAVRLNVPLAELGSYAFLQLSAGKFGPPVRDIFEEAQAAEPQNQLYYRALAFVLEGLGERARADEVYESGVRFGGDNVEGSAMLNQRMHWLVGRNELDRARDIGIADPFNAAMLASVDTPEEARGELRRAYDATVAGNPNRRRDIGLWAGHFGDPALALEAMRAAIDEQSGQMQYVWLPQLAPMRRLPEFKAYLRDIGMVAYWQKYGWPPVCRRLDERDFECD
jgi:TolB-like protein